MTLIVGYKINSCPVLFGDVLLSNPKGSGNSISTPAWHTTDEPPTLQIVNMVQKVNLVHEHACFAWAGSYLQARVFATALQAHLEANDLDDKKMLAFLHSFDKADYSDLACIIYTVHEKFLKCYQVNAPEYELDGLKVQTGGTGTGHFIDVISHVYKPPNENDRSERAVIAPGLSYIASAFGEQIMTGCGVDDGWGGAFELAFFANGKFKKIDDVLYVFWTAVQDEKGEFTLRNYPYLVKTNYFGDTFTVMVNDYGIEKRQTRIYNICPLGKTDQTPHTPELTFSYLINYIFIEKANGKRESCTTIMTRKSAMGFTIERRDDAIHLEFSRDFIQELCEAAFGPGIFLKK
jgi:hypothetical protein